MVAAWLGPVSLASLRSAYLHRQPTAQPGSAASAVPCLDLEVLAPRAQGVFYVATGLWPVLHLRSFEAVTGPKTDRWLVRTLGGLIAAVGVALIAGSLERSSSSSRILEIGSALALAAADVIYVSQGRISRTYLGDAAVEGAIIASWWATHRKRL